VLVQLIRKEVREQIFSLKGILWLALASVMFSGLSYSFITVKEMSVLAQVEILITFLKVVLGFGLLMTLIVSAVSIAGEKEKGTLESLLLLPMSKLRLVFCKWLGAMTVWLVTAVIATPYLLALGKGASVYGAMLIFLFVFGTITVGAFAALALALSSMLQSSKNVLVLSIAVFLITSLPAFLGTSIKKTGFGKVIDTISSLSGAMNLLKDMVLNKLSLFTAVTNSISVLVFAAAAFIFLRFAARKLTLQGGE
jgi:ABC-2 type transport system permease protein